MCRGDMDLFACGMAALYGQPATVRYDNISMKNLRYFKEYSYKITK